MISKILSSFEEAVADIPSGVTIMIACFAGPGGFPYFLVNALAKHRARELTIISNTAGGIGLTFDFDDHKILFENNQVKRVIASFPFSVSPSKPTCAEKQIISGEVMLELVPQGTLVERIRAGGAGIPAFYTPTGVGTAVAQGKEERVFAARPCLLEHALRADYAFIRAYKADKMGNLVYRGTQRHLNPVMATAADIVIAEVDEVVEVGAIDPEAIVTPGIFVDRIVEIEKDPGFPRHLNRSFRARQKKRSGK